MAGPPRIRTGVPRQPIARNLLILVSEGRYRTGEPPDAVARPEVSGQHDACGKLYSVPSQTVTVTGIGADGWPGLSPLSKAALEQAEVVVGSPRQLALLPRLMAPLEPADGLWIA